MSNPLGTDIRISLFLVRPHSYSGFDSPFFSSKKINFSRKKNLKDGYKLFSKDFLSGFSFDSRSEHSRDNAQSNGPSSSHYSNGTDLPYCLACQAKVCICGCVCICVARVLTCFIDHYIFSYGLSHIEYRSWANMNGDKRPASHQPDRISLASREIRDAIATSTL